MQIQITPGEYELTAAIEERVHQAVAKATKAFSDQITRVEVHLRDDKAKRRGPDDKRCTMEARLTGLKPLAVEHASHDLYLAIDEAAGKLGRAAGHALGKLGRATP